MGWSLHIESTNSMIESTDSTMESTDSMILTKHNVMTNTRGALTSKLVIRLLACDVHNVFGKMGWAVSPVSSINGH